jgi:hypothetical protein
MHIAHEVNFVNPLQNVEQRFFMPSNQSPSKKDLSLDASFGNMYLYEE